MGLNFPTSIKTIYTRVVSDIRSALSYSITFLKNSFFKSIAVAFSTRIYEFYELLKAAIRAAFIYTAEGEFLDLFLSIWGINRFPSTQSSGYLTILGSSGVTIPQNTVFVASTEVQYESKTTTQTDNPVFSVNSLIRDGSTVTATSLIEHKYVSGMNIVVSGADQAEYNGTFEIIVIDVDKFSYEITGTPISPATGTITAQSDSYYASIEVDSISFGSDTNLDFGVVLNIQTPIPALEATATVQIEGLLGGSDEETDPEARIRLFEKIANPSAPFGEANIVRLAKTFPEVTRAFVKSTYPGVGDTSVYVVMDNRENILPFISELDDIKDKISDELKPMSMDFNDLYVKAPNITDTIFNVTGLIPNTSTMQEAIGNNLNAYFRTEPQLAVSITETIYTSVIANTIDPTNNNKIQDFSLVSPTGNIGGGAEELVTFDSVNFV